MSGLKKSPSGSSVKSTGSTNSNNASAAANGVKPEPRKKSDFFAKFKQYFTRVTPAPTNRVGCQLWPVVTVLKYGGTLPLFVSEKGDQIVAPSFSSVQTLPSLALAGLFLYWWASVIFVDDRPVPEEPPPFSLHSFLLRTNSVIQSLVKISEILMGWFTCKKMAEYINNWQGFEGNFNGTFKDIYKYKLGIRRFRDSLLIFYVILSALYFIQNRELVLAPRLMSTNNSIVSTILTFSLVLFSFTEDVKTVLMYRITQENFREMRNAIAAQHKMTITSVSKTPLGPEKVKQWIHLINMIRNQQKLACEIQAPHQILTIGLNIVFMANNLFLAVHSVVAYASNKGNISYLPLAVSAIIFGRLFFKCFMAEKLAEEEQNIGEELVQMEASGGNIFIKMELKFLYDLIVNKPTVTSFSNVFILNKAFALKVLGHSLKCLVILIQFNIFIMVESPLILSY